MYHCTPGPNPEALDFRVASGYLFLRNAMIEELLQQEEGKTLEFKENSKSLDRIIHTIIAFANTAGGKVLIGVRDKTKEIVGLQDPVEEEMRLANAIADSIEPLFTPDIHVVSWRNKEFLVIQVPHSIGPYYAKAKGLKKGTYIRLGSTNRLADAAILAELERLGENECKVEVTSYLVNYQLNSLSSC